jgi:hypothetical protein
MDQSSLKSGQQNLTMGTLPNLEIRKKFLKIKNMIDLKEREHSKSQKFPWFH